MKGDTDRLSDWVDFFAYNPASRHRRRLIMKLLEPLQFDAALDIGCGDGSLLLTLRERFGCGIYGLDRRPDAVAAARGILDGYYAMDISATKPDRTFDLVLCCEVLEHVPEDAKAMGSIGELCSRYAVITVPAGPVRATDRLMGHLRHYTRGSIEDLLRASGLRAVCIISWGFPFHSAYKWIQDLLPGFLMGGFGKANYGWIEKALCTLLYLVFFANSGRGGMQLIVLAEKRSVAFLPRDRPR